MASYLADVTCSSPGMCGCMNQNGKWPCTDTHMIEQRTFYADVLVAL